METSGSSREWNVAEWAVDPCRMGPQGIDGGRGGLEVRVWDSFEWG